MAIVQCLLNELLDGNLNSRMNNSFGLLNDVFYNLAQDMGPRSRCACHGANCSGKDCSCCRTQKSGVIALVNDKKEFKVNLDVQHFKPEELKVTIDDGYLVVDGKHEEKTDEHGFISRQFRRKYKIPEDVDVNAIATNLSSDGVLSLHAPKVIKEDEARELPITFTNQPMRITAEQETKAQEQPEINSKL